MGNVRKGCHVFSGHGIDTDGGTDGSDGSGGGGWSGTDGCSVCDGDDTVSLLMLLLRHSYPYS